jgi:hypothetical protein
MKLLVVSENEQEKKALEDISQSNPNVILIQYFHPIKAMDNISEIRPDLIIWSYQDFPRHWKPFLPYLNQEGLEDCKFILYSEIPLEESEREKAETLNVFSIIEAPLVSPQAKEILEPLLPKPAISSGAGFAPVARAEDELEDDSLQGEAAGNISILLTNPENYRIITGKIVFISTKRFALDLGDLRQRIQLSSPSFLFPVNIKLGGHLFQTACEYQESAQGDYFHWIDPSLEFIDSLKNYISYSQFQQTS